MKIEASATNDGEVRVDLYEGPLATVVLFAIDDEEAVLELLRKAFRDAKAIKAGFSKDEIETMNREGRLPVA